MRQAYEDFIDYWAIPLSVATVIIAMIVSYYIKENEDE
jgi:hypothetical protein